MASETLVLMLVRDAVSPKYQNDTEARSSVRKGDDPLKEKLASKPSTLNASVCSLHEVWWKARLAAE